MLDAKIKNQIRSSFEAAKRELPDFNNRSSQNVMIAEIAKTLSKEYPDFNPIICVEAPTGTGKTLAYLIGTLLIALKNKKKLIIASANVALQEQILYKDIIEAKKYLVVDFKYAIAKGRSRYVCIRNLINLTDETSSTQSMFEDSLLWDSPPSQHQLDKMYEMTDDYSTARWNGEIDSLESPPEGVLWQKIACNRFTCNAKNCEFYSDCAFFKARKKISKADVIIANHDLVLADIFSGNSILPDVEDCIFIFDEAHHFSHKALSHFSIGTSTEFIKTSIHQAQIAIDQIAKATLQEKSKNFVNNTVNAINDLSETLLDMEYQDDIHLFSIFGVASDILNLANIVLKHINTAFDNFIDQKDAWQSYIKRHTLEQNTVDNLNSMIGLNEQNLSSIIQVLSAFTQKYNSTKPPVSQWIERSNLSNKKFNFHINSAKIDVSEHLNKLIWLNAAGIVLTSATLTSLNSFDRFNSQLGLNNNENKYLRLPSPFNFKSVDFIVANMNTSPKDIYEHTQELASELIKRINQESATLVLFASNNQMQMVADLLEPSLNCQLLVQGEYSKKRILEKHLERREKNMGSVIFGLDSFAEGVDLKGDNLNHVMIAKLRFSVPTSPIEKTTQSYFESLNRNPFLEIALPDASLRLVQACGRLIRSENDTGKISIFDNRLKTKFYGKQLLDALPGYNIIIE